MITVKNTQAEALNLFHATKVSKAIPVFDLDGVVVDATHRQICNPDGTLNLDKYREMSTDAHISKDTPLAFADTARMLSRENYPFFVCTARVVCKSTIKWLTKQGISPLAFMGREGENDYRRDAELKRYHLQKMFTPEQLKTAYLIDDNEKNCKMAVSLQMKAIHVPFNGH